ncbi:MAG: DUF1295 domain-containing protein [Elusimicrobia bacterium]|nr:DUF1295 domain-containing protein [Elusimicrobiota bacterium]
MLLRDELEREGNFIFRWRGWLAFLVLPLFAAAGFRGEKFATPLNVYTVLCLTVSFLGLAVRCFTVGFVPKGTSGRNKLRQEAESLNTTGMYSVVRHPLYLGNFTIFFGVVMFMRDFWSAAVSVLLAWLYFERMMIAEDGFLEKSFGDGYRKWADGTPTFIPNFRLWRSPDREFSLKTVLRREYSGFFAIILTYSVLDSAAGYISNGKFLLAKHWVYMLSFGAVFYVTVLFLKKKTKILDEPGRV